MAFKVSFVSRNGEVGSLVFASIELAQIYAKTVKSPTITEVEVSAPTVSVKSVDMATHQKYKNASPWRKGMIVPSAAKRRAEARQEMLQAAEELPETDVSHFIAAIG